MKSIARFLAAAPLVAFLSTVACGQGTYYWVGGSSAAWNVSTSWNTASNGSGSARTTPNVADVLIFDGSVTATVSATAVPTQTIAQLNLTNSAAVTLTGGSGGLTLSVGTSMSVPSGSSLTLANGGTSFKLKYLTGAASPTGTIAGTLTVNTSATWDVTTGTTPSTSISGTVVNAGGAVTGSATTLTFGNGSTFQFAATSGQTLPLATWGTGSTCLVTGITSATGLTNGSQSFYNFTWNCPGQTVTNNWGWADGLAIAGTVTISSTGWSGTVGKVRFTSAGASAKTFTISGDLILNSSTSYLELTGSAGAGLLTVNVLGNINMTAGNLYLVAANTPWAWNLSGNLSLTGGTLGKGSGSGSLNFVKLGTQTVSANGITYTSNSTSSNINFVVNTGSTVQLAQNSSVNAITMSGGAVDINSFALSYVNTSNGATPSLTYNSAGGAQTTTDNEFPSANGPANLVISNSSGVMLHASRSVSGTLTMISGALTLSSSTLSYGASGTLAYNGTSSQTSTDAEFPSSNGPANLALLNSVGVSIHAARTLTGMLTLGGNNTYSNLSNVSGYTGITYAATTAQATSTELGSSITNLTINNSNGVTLGGSTSVTGTLTLTSGTFTVGANTLTLQNPIAGTTANLSAGSTSSITIAGSATNINIPSGVTSLANLTLNNSNGTTLQGALNLSGTLALTSGNVTLGANNLVVASAITGGGASNYVVTNSTGMLQQTIGASSSKPFPIGTSTVYAPVTMANQDVSSSDGYGTLVAADVTGSNAGADRVQLKWTAGRSGSTVYAITFQWPGSAEGTNFTANRSSYGQLYDMTSPTTDLNMSPGTVSGSDPFTLTSVNTLNTNTSYAIGNGAAALPVEMVSFSAKAARLSAELHWSTATETNNFGFDIERKTTTDSWARVGFIAGAGTSTSLHNYSYTDNVGQAGSYEYRIKQIDKDGKFKYSSVTQVEVGAVAKILSLGANYPNPFNPSTSIEFSVPTDGRVMLKIYNMLGQEVATLFDGEATAGRLLKATFDASRLSSGVYFSRLEFGANALVKRMMLVK